MPICIPPEEFYAAICERQSLDRLITDRCITQFNSLQRHGDNKIALLRAASRARVSASKSLRSAMFKVCSGNSVEHFGSVMEATAQHTAAIILESWLLRRSAMSSHDHSLAILAAQVAPTRESASGREARK